jgi:hypothetical protein
MLSGGLEIETPILQRRCRGVRYCACWEEAAMDLLAWPKTLRCPACHKLSGEFLSSVSLAASKPHYRCKVCAHTWIPNGPPPIRVAPESAA